MLVQIRVVPKITDGVTVRITPIRGNRYGQRGSMLSDGKPIADHIIKGADGGISNAARDQVKITPGPDQGSCARGKNPNAGLAVRNTVKNATPIHPQKKPRLLLVRAINFQRYVRGISAQSEGAASIGE